MEAIEACNEEDWNREIAMPEGVLYRGLTFAPASAIVEAHHLDTWITNEGDY
jgi:(2Fe-2S) ferredoxin